MEKFDTIETYNYTIEDSDTYIDIYQEDILSSEKQGHTISLSKQQLPDIIYNLKKIYKEYKNSGRK